MQEEGLSLIAQNNRLQDYAERKGLEIIKIFEIVESSTHGERKQFMEMINFCRKQSETIAIVADTVDRVQRSFKESVLLDELMHKDKIELHFYREGMVLNSKSTSVDIMRWDFSVMGAKAYVLQLSENVRRSNEQKNKNGEITGQAPLGYENYMTEQGRKFVRPKEHDAPIIRKLFEMYSMGNTSVAELVHYANIMGLRSRKGEPVSINSIHYMLQNPFYYGEMRTVRGLMSHVYTPIISKQVWDLCQEQKILRAGCSPIYTQKPFLLKGIVTCGIRHRTCPCELKKGRFSYIVCWKSDKKRIYLHEEDVVKLISSVLSEIRLPDNVVSELEEELKNSKASERKFHAQEIKTLRQEQEVLKQKLDTLFDLRLDGELDRETFDIKRNELQIKLNRLRNKVTAHEKADNAFNETLLDLLDIATQASYIFEKSQNLELKRLLIKFVFDKLILTEGVLSYKLKFPFKMFVDKNKKFELMKELENQGLRGKNNKNLQIEPLISIEPNISAQKQGVAPKNATPLQIGERVGIRTRDPLIKSQMLYRLSYAPKCNVLIYKR